MIRFTQISLAMLIAFSLVARPSVAGQYTATDLPDGAWLVVSMPQYTKTYESFTKTPLYAALEKLFELPELKQEMGDEFNAKMEEARLEVGFPVNVKSISQIIGGGDFSLFFKEGVGETPDFETDLEFMLTLKIADPDKFGRLLKYLEKKGEEEAQLNGNEIKKEMFAGKKLTILKLPNPSQPDMAHAMASKDVFVFGTVNQVKRYLTYVAKGGKKLADNKKFQASVKQMPAQQYDVFVYCDQAVIIKALQQANPAIANFPTEGGSTNLVAGTVVKTDRFETFGFTPVEMSGDQKMIDAIKSAVPTNMTAGKYVSKNSLLATWANTFYGLLIYDQVLDSINQAMSMFNPGGPTVADNLKVIEQQLGFSFREDLMKSVGPEMLIDFQSLNMTLMELGIGLQIKDAAKIEKVLTGLEGYINQIGAMPTQPGQPPQNIVESKTVGGASVKQINHPMLMMAGGYSPCFASNGEFLFITTTLGSLQKMLNTKKSGESIMTNTDFKAVTDFIDKKTNSIMLLDIKGTSEAVEMVITMLQGSSMAPEEIKMFRTIMGVFKSMDKAAMSSTLGSNGSLVKGVLTMKAAE